jgi:hypothetical protein
MKEFWNVSVTATKSGKLQDKTHKRFLDNVTRAIREEVSANFLFPGRTD